ncbi:hypothetical protein, partial [Acholeplasma equifetale]|uniref:hypothetical protein n=2 Tax=Acholeplasma equifetale TaxID=264634 RepID=UPI00047BE909
MHDNIIQLLFLESIKNRIEHLETHRKDGKLIIDIRLKKDHIQCLICQDQMKFHSYRLKQIHYGISSFEAYNIHYQSRR